MNAAHFLKLAENYECPRMTFDELYDRILKLIEKYAKKGKMKIIIWKCL